MQVLESQMKSNRNRIDHSFSNLSLFYRHRRRRCQFVIIRTWSYCVFIFTCASHIILGCYLATKSKHPRLADAKPAARGVREKKRSWRWRKIKMEWETKLRKVYRAGTGKGRIGGRNGRRRRYFNFQVSKIVGQCN